MKLFCPEPFEHLEIVPGGDVHVCCSGWIPRPVGNMLETPLMEIFWGGARLQEVRNSILDNTFSYCLECPFLPGPCGPVRKVPADLSTDFLRAIPFAKINLLTLAYERTCNLACPSCRTGIFKSDRAHEDQARAISLRLIDSGALAHVERIVVTGSGDPFASPVYLDLFHDLPWHRYPDLKVRLFTNALLCDQVGWQKLGAAQKRVDQVSVSLDAATPETYAKNRRGDWRKLHVNLAALAMLRGLETLNRLELTFTVQANNFHEMPAFVDLATSLGADVIFFGKLRNWGAYTPWDYACRSVHVPQHPLHRELLEVLKDERLHRSEVVLANFGQVDT